jgi:hypothetical protein
VLGVLVSFLLTEPLHVFTPTSVGAEATGPVQVGISFSAERAEALGLDYQVAFRRLEAMHFRLIRLSVYWDEADNFGYQDVDWLMAEAQRKGQPVALAVGMKGLGWPEFFIPMRVKPVDLGNGKDVASDSDLRQAALQFIQSTVDRYRNNRALVAWQVENEPFDRAGPQRWWIDSGFVSEEVETVRLLDHHDRPVILNTFSHFNLIFDEASNRGGFDVKQLLGFDSNSAEQDSLALLHRGDILGLDVYTAIGYHFLGQNHLVQADADWADQLQHLRDAAQAQGKQAWITEAQAEPWEATYATYADPVSTSPTAIRHLFVALKDAGFKTILLWGSEYWLWRADNGDPRWINTVQQILDSEGKAPAVRPVA